MAKTLVIVGAGASHGCAPSGVMVRSHGLRPPLTVKLFSQSLIKDKYLQDCPHFRSFIPELENALNATGGRSSKNLEVVLRSFQKKAGEGNILREKQLGDLKAYLAHFFCDVSRNYLNSGSAYDILCSSLFDQGKEPVFVSFNYDTLLEDALHAVYGVEYQKISDYLSQSPMLIKPHGSWNWSYHHEKSKEIIVNRIRQRPRQYDPIGNQLDFPTGPLSRPALGLPIEDHKEYVCPDKHVNVLFDLASEIEELLIIGWRADEPHFVDFFSRIGMGCKVTIVSKSPQGGRAIFDRIGVADPDPTILAGGFDAYIKSLMV